MATEKVKKPRKPRKPITKTGSKSVTSRKKRSVKREIVPSAQVLFKDKIQLHELPTLEHITENEVSSGIISIDTSVSGENKSISSIGTPLYKFSGITGNELSSDVPYLLDEAAAKRYHTKANELSAYDLRLFSDYDQRGTKKTYFNDHPYVVHDIDINSLQYEQLLTKNNLEEAERYFVNRFLNSNNKLKTHNWETDRDYVKLNDGKQRYEISSLNEMLELDKWDSQATYKFDWGNDKRTTNVVDLKINSSYYYSVVGIVSVKSIFPDQKSGTIYLEAKPRNAEDSDDNWVVVDSAVFKFDKDKKNVGTYVTLTGYMSPNYVTRLKLNLRPKAYSMNNWEYREKGSISNHYSNTFVGTAYILDDFLSSETIEIPVDIKFTDSNYAEYKFNNNVLTADLTNDFKDYFQEDSQVYMVPVSDVVQKIAEHLPNSNIRTLDISTGTQSGRNGFAINGLRYSPTGNIYPLSSTMNLFSNCVLYPSYSSGTITVQQSSLHDATYEINDIGESWQSGRVLYNLNTSNLSALSNLDWPRNTEIYGNHLISGTIEQVNSTTLQSNQYQTINRSNPVAINNQVVESTARYKPRVCDQLITHKIDFSNVLRNYDVVGNITCYITATPKTWGGAGGESYGVVRYGFTSATELNNLKTNASSTVIAPKRFVTKNITRWISDKLCTGTRWNVHEGVLKTSFEQDSRYKQIWIQAVAYTAVGDTSITHFSVTANVILYFKYRTMVSGTQETMTTSSVTSQFDFSTSGTRENIVQDTKIYPILSTSQSAVATTRPSMPNELRVDNITATGSFRDTTLTVIPYPQNISWQS